MATLKILAGDFPKGEAHLFFGMLSFKNGQKVQIKNIQTVSQTSEEKVKKFFGTVGWGAVGALALGPLGAVAGLLAGGNEKEVTFIAEFYDGKKMLASTSSKTYQDILAASFK